MPLGWQELAIIMVIVLIIFGAGKLPEIGGALGKGIKEFRTATHEEEETLEPPVEPARPTTAEAQYEPEEAAASEPESPPSERARDSA